MTRPRFSRCAVFGSTALAFLAATAAVPASAQSDSEFYRGKSITLGIPSDAGGGYDTYVRLLARHYAKHIPGNPNMVPQNVPGGGGLVQANRLYNTEAKDGTAIGLVRGSVLYEGVFGNPRAKFDGRKFAWLGNLNADRDTCVFWHTAGVDSPKDLYGKEVLMGATGTGAMSFSFPSVYNDVLGTKLKIIMGYKGTADRVLAMERGEIQGACGLTTGTFRATLEQPYKEGKLKLVAIAGFTKDPHFPEAPNMLDEAKTPEQRQALEFLFAQMEVGRAMAAPPGTPKVRVDILRRGFDATVTDPEFIADANKLKLDVSPISGAETEQVVAKFYATPDAVVQKVRAALGPNAK
jgi:tripartite-type tricarboxylate transporter receptor subunit TctC